MIIIRVTEKDYLIKVTTILFNYCKLKLNTVKPVYIYHSWCNRGTVNTIYRGGKFTKVK